MSRAASGVSRPRRRAFLYRGSAPSPFVHPATVRSKRDRQPALSAGARRGEAGEAQRPRRDRSLPRRGTAGRRRGARLPARDARRPVHHPGGVRPLRRARRSGRRRRASRPRRSASTCSTRWPTRSPRRASSRSAASSPVSLDDLLAGSPRLLAILEEVRDPGQRRHHHPGRGCRGSRRRHPDRPQRGRLQPEGGPLDDRLDLPPAGRAGRSRSTRLWMRCAPPACGSWPPTSRATICPTCAPSSRSRPRGCSATRRTGSPTSRCELADRIVKVPIYGHAESMNLATAASVCLYESAFAQR